MLIACFRLYCFDRIAILFTSGWTLNILFYILTWVQFMCMCISVWTFVYMFGIYMYTHLYTYFQGYYFSFFFLFTLPYTSVWYLMKTEPLDHPRLRSSTLLFNYMYVFSGCAWGLIFFVCVCVRARASEISIFFIIKGFWAIVFIFNLISLTFRPICPPAFFRCLSNSVTYTELRTTSFIESTGWISMLGLLSRSL